MRNVIVLRQNPCSFSQWSGGAPGAAAGFSCLVGAVICLFAHRGQFVALVISQRPGLALVEFLVVSVIKA